MKIPLQAQEEGSTLMVTIGVVATMLVLLGSAIEYTTHISRVAQRSRGTALAMEVADGHLETLYSNWRNIYRTTWTTLSNNQGGTDRSIVGTNFFYTDMYAPGPVPTPLPSMTPAATPPIIALPPSSNFPSATGYTVTQYRIQAVDPMITLDASENSNVNPAATPPAAYGPNNWQYSYFYLAAADVTVPTSTGPVTAKVRRVFEKKFDNPWTYAMFYVDDLELQPQAAMTMDGPIHTNGSLYLGTSFFTTTSRLEYGGEYVNGFSPLDGAHSGPTAPNLVSDMPPSQVSPYLPFGWNLNLDGSTNNNKSYHELIERPVTGTGVTDPLSEIRLYNQAGYRILIDANNAITITGKSGAAPNGGDYNAIVGTITTNKVMYDPREVGYVRMADVNIANLITELKKLGEWNGVIYIADTSAKNVDNGGNITNAGTTAVPALTFSGSGVTDQFKRAIRFTNGATLPSGGMTIVSDNPVYVLGDFNTGGSPPSNSGTYTSPTVSGYARRNAAIIADAVTILSGAWNDSNSNKATPARDAGNATVNAAIVAGNVPSGSSGSNYSGGGESFVRFLEDWTGNHFTYYGSMVQLYKSQQGTGLWVTPGGTVYKSPTRHWFYDTNFGNSSPPGNLQIAAYLQQQRWYQVY